MSARGAHAEQFDRCMSVGGVAVFGADTVYGLACDVHNREAVERLYRLKHRPLDKPSAVMFFDVGLALAALPELGPATRAALQRLLPGPVTFLLPNPELRFPLACGEDQSTFGLRVPVVASLAGVGWPILQSSANLAGEPDARRLADVPAVLRSAADLVLDEGELPGTPSTVVDVRRYEETGEWSIVRQGGLPERDVAAGLGHQFHFDPDSYMAEIIADIPDYEEFQAEVARATGSGAQRVLELGTGTGETAKRVLAAHPQAHLTGVDESAGMLGHAAAQLPGDRVTLEVGTIEGRLPAGPFDLVVSALCVHHLPGTQKRDLFARLHAALAPGGRLVLGDVVAPVDPAEAAIPLTDGYDHPSPLADQLRWLGEAGFAEVTVTWQRAELAVIVAALRS